jgi:hypothetical protein
MTHLKIFLKNKKRQNVICINQVLDNFLKQQENWKHYLMANWNHIVGAIAHHARIEKIENETLVIGVSDSVWLQELYMLSPLLLNKINQSLDKPHLKKIRLKHAAPKKYCRNKNKPIRQAIAPVQRALTSREKNALQKISDDELSRALTNFLMRCHQVTHS